MPFKVRPQKGEDLMCIHLSSPESAKASNSQNLTQNIKTTSPSQETEMQDFFFAGSSFDLVKRIFPLGH